MPEVTPRTILKNHPEISIQVGIVVAEYAILEQFMLIIYALICDLEPALAFNEFFNLRSTNLRKELVLKSAEAMSKDCQAALRRLWRRFAKAADRRTEIAHCTYVEQGGQLFRLQLAAGRPKFVPFDPSYFSRTLTQYHNLGTDLATFAALIAGSAERIHSVVRSLPLSPGFDTRVWPQADPRPPGQSLLDQTAASLSRLGLDHLVKD